MKPHRAYNENNLQPRRFIYIRIRRVRRERNAQFRDRLEACANVRAIVRGCVLIYELLSFPADGV